MSLSLNNNLPKMAAKLERITKGCSKRAKELSLVFK